MPCYVVTLSASGDATLTVDAADAEAAEAAALLEVPDLILTGVGVEWTVEAIEEIEE